MKQMRMLFSSETEKVEANLERLWRCLLRASRLLTYSIVRAAHQNLLSLLLSRRRGRSTRVCSTPGYSKCSRQSNWEGPVHMSGKK